MTSVNRPGSLCPNTMSMLVFSEMPFSLKKAEVAMPWMNASRLASTTPVPNLKYLTENGTNAPLGITRYHLDLQTLFFAMLDRNRDDKGILFPRAFAPFDVHLVALNVDKPEVAPAAMRVCGELESRGLAVLYDDRAESAGVKFNDADLIGCPVRVVISPRALAQNAAEVKRRAEQGARVVKLDEVGSVIGKW